MSDAARAVVVFSGVETLDTAFQVLFRNFVPFMSLALLFSVPTLWPLVAEGANEADDPTRIRIGADETDLLLGLIAWLLFAVLVVSLTYGTVQDLRGRKPEFRACLAQGVARAIPAVIVGFVVGVLSFIGLVFFIIPGLVVYAILWVSIPVVVFERVGPLASLGRSATLTKGHRSSIFFIYALLLFFLIFLAFLLTVFPVLLLTETSGAISGAVVEFVASLRVPLILFDWLLTSFIAAVAAILPAVGYHVLRSAKEGVDIEQIASVFD